MKNLLSYILLCLIYVTCNIAFAKSVEPLDGIIAVVNDDVVTSSELNRSLAIVKMQIAQQHVSVPTEIVLKKQVLDQLVNKKLQLQMAHQANIYVHDEDLDNTIEMIAKHNNLTVEELYRHISREGMSKHDYRVELREQLTLKKLQEEQLASHIHITPDEVNNFLHSKNWQNNTSKEYHLEDILIPVSDTPSTEEISAAKKRAQMVMAKLKRQNFQTVAQSESGDKNALQGGDLGWRKLPEIPSAFAEHVVRMHLNEIAGPIQTPNGFHIIRLAEERSIGHEATPDRQQVEHLLFQRKFEEALQNWLSKLRSQAFISSPEKA